MEDTISIKLKTHKPSLTVHPGKVDLHQDPVVNRRLEIIKEAFLSSNIAMTCRLFGISRPTYYNYRKAFIKSGLVGLKNKSRCHHSHPLTKPEDIPDRIIQLAKDNPKLGYKKIFRILCNDGVDITARTVQNILKKNKLNTHFLREQEYQESLKMASEAEEYY